MLKLIGAVLVLFAGTMYGFLKALSFARRPRQIRQLIQALQRLETEMVYGFTPLPEALRSAAAAMAEPLSAMFLEAAEKLSGDTGKTVRECWREAVESHWGRTAMSANERDIVIQLGFTLGVTDREDQVKHLRLAASLLQAEEETAWDEQRRYEKMWKSLGILAAAFIVILMY